MAENDFNYVPVESTQLSAVAYNPDTREMRIQFAKGQIYSYSNVPSDIYDSLLNAPSVGQYFNTNVKFSFNYVKLS